MSVFVNEEVRTLVTAASTIQHKPRILVVDDSRVMRRALGKILGQDYEVVEADHGEDGWTMLLNDNAIQVVFTDLSMPYLDGFGLLARIRSAEDARLAGLPVIVITGKDDDEDTKQQALNAGASDFITKPFESVQLKARAKVHVDHQQAHRRLSETSAFLHEQPTIDPLTGLGTKAYFAGAAAESVAQVRRQGGSLGLLRIDLDHFNQLFMKGGKAAADQVLAQVGQSLAGQLRQDDRGARIGLAKFAILLHGADPDGARKLAERIAAQARTMEFEHAGQRQPLSVSIGIAHVREPASAALDALLAEAEAQLAEALRAGGNRIRPVEGELATPDLGSALVRLANGDSDGLAPHAAALARQALPLLELYARDADEEVQTWVSGLKQRLAGA